MFTIAPLLGLAIAAFALSVVYEFEIYWQNIKGAFNKLFKQNFLKNQLANNSLLKQFESNAIDTKTEDCPQFFKDYEAQLNLLHKFGHKRLDKKSAEAKRKIEKTLKDMEKWYALQLFSEGADTQELTNYEKELRIWLKISKQAKMRKLYQLHLSQQEGIEQPLSEENSATCQWIDTYLQTQFKKQIINTEAPNCPQFFKDYKTRLDLLDTFESISLSEEQQVVKEESEQILNGMQARFALLMFSKDDIQNLNQYEKELCDWMNATPYEEEKTLYAKRSTIYKWVIGFSAVSGFFMSIGITYLLVEAFSILPVLAAISFSTLPAIIVPMALICGAAYTFLIYNAVTDMIHNDTLRKWYYNICRDLKKEGFLSRAGGMALAAVVLLVLTVALTVCTAGTWWTVAKNARPIFSWMSKMPSFIMGVITPVVLGASQLIFNLQNTSDTLEMIDDASRIQEGLFTRIAKGIADAYHHMMDNENWLQILNPFRLILKLTVTPLRIIFFFGHLISIGVTADRVPGIPEIASAILGIISEGFEDAHYFIGDILHNHDHHGHDHSDTKKLLKERFDKSHSHDHSTDIPSRLIAFLFSPLYAFATGWDYVAARLVKKTADPCGLIHIQGEVKPSFERLREHLQGGNSVVLYNNKLYYASQRKENIKAIKQSAENVQIYEIIKEKCTNQHRFAEADELEIISSLAQTKRHSVDNEPSWKEAWDKQIGRPHEESVKIEPTAARPSRRWQHEQTVHQINRYLEKHLSGAIINKQLAAEKAAGLVELRQNLRVIHNADEGAIRARVLQEAQKTVYSQQRFFNTSNKTRTENFLAELPERIRAASSG